MSPSGSVTAQNPSDWYTWPSWMVVSPVQSHPELWRGPFPLSVMLTPTKLPNQTTTPGVCSVTSPFAWNDAMPVVVPWSADCAGIQKASPSRARNSLFALSDFLFADFVCPFFFVHCYGALVQMSANGAAPRGGTLCLEPILNLLIGFNEAGNSGSACTAIRRWLRVARTGTAHFPLCPRICLCHL